MHSDSQQFSFEYDRQSAVDYAHFYTRGQGQKRRKYIRYISGAADSFLSRANPEFYFYFQNCAAFISQCLYAGGFPMTEAWHQLCRRRGGSTLPGKEKRWLLSSVLMLLQRLKKLLGLESWDVSQAWRAAPACFEYFTDEKRGFARSPLLSVSSRDEIAGLISEGLVRLGDIIYLEKKGEIAHCLIITRLSEDEIYYCANKYTRYDMELSFAFAEEGTRALILPLKDRLSIDSGDIYDEK